MMNNKKPPPIPINENLTIKLAAFKKRLAKGEIWINGPIDDSLIEKLYVNLIDLNQTNPNLGITVVINSNGGGFYEAIVATDIMGTLNSPVKTVGLANVCSGGFILFMGGKERIAHDYTCFMMHSIGFGVANKIPEVEARLDYIKQSQKKMAHFFSYQTNGKTTPEYWMTLFQSGRDKWFSVDEALELGIVHKIIRRPEMVNPNSHIRKPFTWDIYDIIKSQS